MNPDYLPVLIIVGFVVYPFAVIGLTALIGCIYAAWFMLAYGLGKIPPVTIVASAVFVLGVAATGGLLGAIAELFVPTRTDAGERGAEPTEDDADDENPYRAPRSH